VSTSLIAKPSFDGGPPGYPVTCMNPERAYMMRSNAGDSARGPESPYPDMDA